MVHFGSKKSRKAFRLKSSHYHLMWLIYRLGVSNYKSGKSYRTNQKPLLAFRPYGHFLLEKVRESFSPKQLSLSSIHNINMFWTNLSENRVVLMGHRRETPILSLLARKITETFSPKKLSLSSIHNINMFGTNLSGKKK